MRRTLVLLLIAGCKHSEPTVDASAASAAPPAASSSAPVAVAAPDASPPAASFLSFDPATTLREHARPFIGSAKVDEIGAAFAATNVPPTEAIAALRDELASEVRAGKIDEAKLRAKKEALRTAMKPVLDGEIAALDTLHAALTAAQREAVVTRSRNKHAPVTGHVVTARTKRWIAGLAVDDAIRQKLDAAVPSPQALGDAFDDRMTALLDAFDKDSFSAKKLPAFDPKHAAMPLDEETAFVRRILGVLPADPRSIVADRIAAEPVVAIKD